jgi:hypothetical protein
MKIADERAREKVETRNELEQLGNQIRNVLVNE